MCARFLCDFFYSVIVFTFVCLYFSSFFFFVFYLSFAKRIFFCWYYELNDAEVRLLSKNALSK